MQSKQLTAIESATMAIAGYFCSVFGQMLIFWVLDMPWNFLQCVAIAGFFSILSFFKNFGIRRFFEKFGKKISKYLKMRKRKKNKNR